MAQTDSSKQKIKESKRKPLSVHDSYDRLSTVYKKYMRQHAGHGASERENT